MNPLPCAYGDTITQPADPTMAGYDFEGWSVEINDSSTAWDFSTDLDATNAPGGALTLYALWGEPSIALNFVDSAGNATNNASGYFGVSTEAAAARPTLSGKVQDNSSTLVLTPSNGYLTGSAQYVFYSSDGIHWHKTSAVIASSGTGDVTIYTITYDANDPNMTSSPAPQYVPEGTNSTLTTDVPSGDNSAVCVGWDTTPDGTNGTLYAAGPLSSSLFPAANDGMYGASGVVQSDVTLYAQYVTTTFTVNFYDYNGVLMLSETVPYGGSVIPPTPDVRTGYTFTGWTSNDFTNVTSNLDFHETYAMNVYTVTFVDYDGSIIAMRSVPYDGTATPPANPTRVGYTFVGWDGSYSDVTANTICTAQYTENPGGGGNGGGGNGGNGGGSGNGGTGGGTNGGSNGGGGTTVNNIYQTSPYTATPGSGSLSTNTSTTSNLPSTQTPTTSAMGTQANSTPLSQLASTSGWSPISLLFAILAVILGAAMLLVSFMGSRRKDASQDGADAYDDMRYTMTTNIIRGFACLMALASAILFIAMSSFTGAVSAVNASTIPVIVLFACEVALCIVISARSAHQAGVRSWQDHMTGF
jgi:uncharacterized repeat protein (TIGR02543 family)